MDERTRSYCITTNNPTDEDYEALKALKYTYLCYAPEIAPTTGTPHIQAYVYLSSAMSFSSIQKKLKRSAIFKANGTPEDNRKYILGIDHPKKKFNPDAKEFGIMPKQGKRNDIVQIKEALKEGSNLRSIIEIATSYQSIKTAETLVKYYEKKRTFKPKVFWLYGATGTGKTRYVYDNHPLDDIYKCLDTSRWMDGYDAHPVLLIDDMRRDFIKFHNLIKLIDRYEYRVETKGGTRQLLAETIYITCPYEPKKLWQNHTDEDLGQLIRRIDKIIFFSNDIENASSSPPTVCPSQTPDESGSLDTPPLCPKV